ncbi:MAG: citramalate synthase [Alphaproteobacteria bacterium]|nr:citramalate synthase [Alphaproteobacteria bacterium]
MSEFVYIYDTTLRDGLQGNGVSMSAKDKHTISLWLDQLGIKYIEGGWPGANETDDEFFANLPMLEQAKIAAFGMMRRAHGNGATDPVLQSVLNSPANVVCLFGKSWDYQVTGALQTTLEENLEMIRDSISCAKNTGKEVLFDAEHFFDGYKNNPDYALKCLRAAYEEGADWLVLCDTNGGCDPDEISEIVGSVRKALPEAKLGIHCHNDTDLATANSLAAVKSGCRLVQGTLAGIGERCGNTNLFPTIHNLIKKGYDLGISPEQLSTITKINNDLHELLDLTPNDGQPLVGKGAFAHKGGAHGAAVKNDPKTYEHTPPESVGNHREIVASIQSGKSNLYMKLNEFGFEVDESDPRIPKLLEEVKALEHAGFSYDNATGSFALLAAKNLGLLPKYFTVKNYEVSSKLDAPSCAKVTLCVEGEFMSTASSGDGPVHALDKALRKALLNHYPELNDVSLTDYRVRILDSKEATGAKTRVLVESKDKTSGTVCTTVGVSTNIIDASLQALIDAYNYMLFTNQVTPRERSDYNFGQSATGGKHWNGRKGHDELRP